MKTLFTILLLCGFLILQTSPILARSSAQDSSELSGTTPPGRLISAATAMETAWDIPRNPLTDSLPGEPHIAEQIRYGFRLFVNTPEVAPELSGNGLACSNCHLNAGQREKALPLVGVSGVYPEYNKRAGRLFSIEDRIVECFKRSMNSVSHETPGKSAGPETTSKEVLAIAAYISWLSAGFPVGNSVRWRGLNVISTHNQVPVTQLDPKRGEQLFGELCSNCHGEDGQGLAIGDKQAGPLWGPKSWNDGAGAARIYTLAGMIRHFMPYINPGSLTDEEAEQIARYINSKPRPVFPYKDEDYKGEKIPSDAVYYNLGK